MCNATNSYESDVVHDCMFRNFCLYFNSNLLIFWTRLELVIKVTLPVLPVLVEFGVRGQ